MTVLAELNRLNMEVDGINSMQWMKTELSLFSSEVDASVSFARVKRGQKPQLMADSWKEFLAALEKKGMEASQANEGRALRAQRRLKGTVEADKEIEPKLAGIIGSVRLFFKDG